MRQFIFAIWCACAAVTLFLFASGGFKDGNSLDSDPEEASNSDPSGGGKTGIQIVAQTAGENNILLDFSAEWCGPCRQMAPIVSKLKSQGHPVRKVDVDVEKALAQRFQVHGIPCFVLVKDGREIERVTGMTDERKLLAMMSRLPKPEGEDRAVGKKQEGTQSTSRRQALPIIQSNESRNRGETGAASTRAMQ